MQESAVSSEAVAIGVSNSAQYETLSARLNNFGGHDCRGVLREGSESLCGRCGKSTTGPPIFGRAGDMYPDEGERAQPREERFTTADGKEHITYRNDICDYSEDRVSAGNLYEITDGLDALGEDPNKVDEYTLQPDYAISRSGGTKSRRKTPGNSPDPARMQPQVAA